MLLRIKLLILFIAISLIPLALVSSTGYVNVKNLLAENSIKNIDNIAAIQAKRLDTITKANIERLELVIKNVDLALLVSGQVTDSELLLGTIANIASNISSIEKIEILNLNGNVIASTKNEGPYLNYANNQVFTSALTGQSVNNFIKDSDGRLKLLLSGPIMLDKKTVGVAIITVKASEYVALANDYTGLGHSGETILVKQNNAGEVIYLSPLRFDPFSSLTKVTTAGGANRPMQQAVNKASGTLSDIYDYRGEKVFAAFRHIDSAGIGLVTKIDSTEVLSNADKLRTLFLFFVICSAIVVGFISLTVSKSLAMPINRLKDTAEKIASGVMESKIIVETDDEVGKLAATFNTMAASLKESYTNLENKVSERTKSLVARQKELESEKAKAEAILHSIGEGLIAYDKNGRILLMNHLAEQMIGYKFEEVKDKIHWDLWDLEDKKGNVINVDNRPFQVSLKEHRVVSDRSLYFHKKKGNVTKFPISYTLAPIHIGGELQGVIEVFSDITAEKELEMLKDEFISIVSHELRTPMTAIKGLVSMILEGDFGDVSENIKEPLNNVSFSSERLIHLVNDMLDASSIDAGKLKLKIEDINIKKMVEEVGNSLSSIAKQKGITITSDAVESLWVQTDSEKIREVLNNLIGNSLKFTDKGGITLLTQRDGDLIKLLIQDTGIGISPENQQKLFNKFQQVGVELNNHKQGTGLGLYITRELVRRMGGDLWIEKSEIGVGSTFAFSLPACGTDLANKIKAKVQKEIPV